MPGCAADWSRLAVFTRSPATMPWPARADGHRGLAGQHARARLEARDERLHGVDDLEGRPDAALGVVLVGRRGAPHGHHRVADELLDRAAVALDLLARDVEVAAQELADLLRVAALREAW